MSDINAKPERSWREIAAEAARESNPEKLIELSKELEDVLDHRRKVLDHVAPELNKANAKKKAG
jgi:hypothetical protein